MFQNEYRKMNEKILPKKELRERVMEKASPRRPARIRVAVVAAMLALAILAVPAAAQVSLELATRFRPVMESCTVDGIKMEVVAASVHGATAEVYISFEDLQGDRIDEKLRIEGEELLGKNPFLSGTWGSSLGKFDYNGETGQAIMVMEQNYSFWSALRGRYLTVEELFNGKITVSVDRLYRLVQTEEGDWVEETIAEGPWRVDWKITEVEYVGPRDDGVPLITSLE